MDLTEAFSVNEKDYIESTAEPKMNPVDNVPKAIREDVRSI